MARGEVVLYVGQEPVRAAIDGTLRGLIREIPVKAGRKLGEHFGDVVVQCALLVLPRPRLLSRSCYSPRDSRGTHLEVTGDFGGGKTQVTGTS